MYLYAFRVSNVDSVSCILFLASGPLTSKMELPNLLAHGSVSCFARGKWIIGFQLETAVLHWV